MLKRAVCALLVSMLSFSAAGISFASPEYEDPYEHLYDYEIRHGFRRGG
jgi:hypothetical protein